VIGGFPPQKRVRGKEEESKERPGTRSETKKGKGRNRRVRPHLKKQIKRKRRTGKNVSLFHHFSEEKRKTAPEINPNPRWKPKGKGRRKKKKRGERDPTDFLLHRWGEGGAWR